MILIVDCNITTILTVPTSQKLVFLSTVKWVRRIYFKFFHVCYIFVGMDDSLEISLQKLDEWIAGVKDCQLLSKPELFALCDKVEIQLYDKNR